MQITRAWLRFAAPAAALVLLNVSLTFQNVWPTPGIWWQNALSVELAALVLVMAAARRPPSGVALRWLAALWVLLVLGRYGYVTAPALYGRDVNLYWDLRFVPAVIALLARAVPLRVVLLTGAAAVSIVGLVYGLCRWALGSLGGAMAHPRARRLLALAAAAAVTLFVGQHVSARMPSRPTFTIPVTQAYAQQVRFAAEALTASRSLEPGPVMHSDLALVRGADVFLVFLESYGAASFERAGISERLAGSRAEFDRAIHATHREAVSAYVESPTFGGSSWLAHLSLLSGIEVRDGATHALLMTQKRDTLVRMFARHGFRTVALMPGLQQRWPEAAFYGFDDIYSAERLGYHGPQFGWFAIPDQFAIARLDALEVERRPRAPLFVFFPTISSHTPFVPIAPYQPDWRRMLTDHPYDAAAQDRALAKEPDWLDLGSSYAEAMSYAYDSLGGYLRLREGRDFVLVVLGDHQPPAAVSGEGASWDVPVHVIASRTPVLERLLGRGFRAGLAPAAPPIARMHALLPVLLDAFGDREPVVARK